MFTFHLEVCRPMRDDGEDAGALIERIGAAGMDAGMAINPPTAPQGLAPYLSDLALVLTMSVIPGRSGQKFMPDVLDKVRWLKSRVGDGTRLEIDGGLNRQTAPAATGAGVDVIVSASALFGADDREAAIRELRGAGS